MIMLRVGRWAVRFMAWVGIGVNRDRLRLRDRLRDRVLGLYA
jgi:hypothetical protein